MFAGSFCQETPHSALPSASHRLLMLAEKQINYLVNKSHIRVQLEWCQGEKHKKIDYITN